MMNNNPYKKLAEALDKLPNGFPSSPDGIEIKILAKLFTPDEAELVSQLHLTPETSQQISARLDKEPKVLRNMLKNLAKRGLISVSNLDKGLGYGLLPFVVGIYENQVNTIDTELAKLFEQYYREGFGQMLAQTPSIHRVIPINQSVKANLEVRPYESAAAIIDACRAWGVVDCICRKQKMLIGQPCEHPIDVCLVMSTVPGAFNNSKNIRALSQSEAMETLRRASEAGLVHSVSNNQKDLWYICNCCTCSCGILRGMVDLGIANVIARSSFNSQVDDEKCVLCGTCMERCQFNALKIENSLRIDKNACTGCGLCVLACPEEALSLVLRPEAEQPSVPVSEFAWMVERAQARGIELIE